MKRLAMIVFVVGCGSDSPNPGQADGAIDSPGASIDAAIDSPAATFALTSPNVTEGAAIDEAYTCDGANTSPLLTWSGNAMNAQSYAVTLIDKSNNVIHWVIYDIPASATGLPANVEKVYAPTNVAGAHQTTSYSTTVRGFLGPCPNPQDGAHIYEFAVHGINAATLPGATMATTRMAAITTIMQNMTARATLTGMYDR